MSNEILEKWKEKAKKTEDKATKKAILQGIQKNNLGKQLIYGIRDENLGFTQVFIEKNDGLVCRNVLSAVKAAQANNTPTPLKDFPDQFTIWEVAQIDEDNGTVTGTRRKIINVKDLLDMTN